MAQALRVVIFQPAAREFAEADGVAAAADGAPALPFRLQFLAAQVVGDLLVRAVVGAGEGGARQREGEGVGGLEPAAAEKAEGEAGAQHLHLLDAERLRRALGGVLQAHVQQPGEEIDLVDDAAALRGGDEGADGRWEYAGRVTWISGQAEFTPKTIQTRDERANLVYAVKVAVRNDGFIKRGMYGEMEITAN